MKKVFLLISLLSLAFQTSQAQDIIPLWPNGVPNKSQKNESETQDKGNILWIEKVQVPTLEIYLPTKFNANGKAMVVCPGGGYKGLAYDWEGTDIAKWLNSKGIAAFVLKYRLPNEESVKSSRNPSLQDAERAVRMVRNNAEKWNIKKDQIGIMGFSAGGHLASTVGTHYDQDKNTSPDDLAKSVSSRPDFLVLMYPVITMNPEHTHGGSRKNLIGENPTQDLADFYSNELQVNENTPPTFLVHSTDDKAVPVMNSILFYQALEKDGVYSEMHVYPYGGHGFSLAIDKGHLQSWPERLSDWINSLDEIE
ncbi:MAG: alpha/beta hydrolase [Cyclobacteriaceae bacterium]